MQGDKCRRIVLDREVDGRVDRVDCEVGEERCDVCEQRPRAEKRRRITVEDVTEVAVREQSGEVSDVSGKAETDIDLQDGPEEDIEQEGDDLLGVEDALDKQSELEGVRLQNEFESEMARHELLRRKQIERALVEHISPEEMEAILQSWQDICVICRAKSLEYSDHMTDNCLRASDGDRDYWIAAHALMDELEFEPYACCKFCWSP